MAIRDLLRTQLVSTSLSPAARVNGTATGAAVDLRGFDGAVITFSFGAYTDGTHTPTITHSSDGTTYTTCVFGTDIDGAADLAAVSSGAGANVIIGTMPPRSSSITQAMLANMLLINNWIKDYAAKTTGVYPVDYFSYMLDASSLSNAVQGLPASGTLLADGLHPSGFGAGIMGEVALYNALNGLVKPMSRRPMANLDGSGNGDTSYLTRNPLMLQGAGGTAGTGVSGTVAQYYSIQRYAGSGIGATVSIIARSAGPAFFAVDGLPGSLQKIDFSGATATTDQLTMTFAGSPAPTPGTGPNVIETEFVTAMSSGTLLDFSLTCVFGGSSYVVYSNYNNGAPINVTGTFQGLLRSRPFTIPAGATSMTCILSIKTSVGAAGSAYIGYAGVRKLQA